jgi:hypothetical protein
MLLFWWALSAGASLAPADEASGSRPSTGTAKPVARPVKKEAEPPLAPLPPPQVRLKVTPGPGGAPWRMSIENRGDGPVRIPADPRLLILELTPAGEPEPTDPKAKKKAPSPPPRCVLPADARPSTDDGRDLVIPPKRSWSATFDPLFYCFGARERGALVAGTTVKAVFGWPPPPQQTKAGKAPALVPPLAVTPVGASVGKVSPLKAIEADAFVLTDGVPFASASAHASDGGDRDADGETSAEMTLSIPAALDATRGTELGTTVTLHNRSDRPKTLLFRPDMLTFTVTGPTGVVSCGSPRQVTSPIRELFTTVPVKGKTETTVLLGAACPAGTFDQPGIYRVAPKLDTTGASGRSLGIETWEGVAVTKTPLVVRVRTARHPALPPRPTLD